MLHNDLWQSCESKTGCSTSVNKRKQLTWVDNQKNTEALWNYIYTSTYRVTLSLGVMQSHRKLWRAAGRHWEWGRKVQWPQQFLVEYLSSSKQKHKALNVESQRGLRKFQYSSPPSSLDPHPPSPCLSHMPTASFNPYESNKDERFIFL